MPIPNFFPGSPNSHQVRVAKTVETISKRPQKFPVSNRKPSWKFPVSHMPESFIKRSIYQILPFLSLFLSRVRVFSNNLIVLLTIFCNL